MRRIVMFNRVSAEGYFADSNGGLDWAVPDDELDQAAVGGMGSIDAMLLGRKTYDMFESFWPHALKDERGARDPHTEGRRSSSLHALAVWINDTPKYVVSRTRHELPWKNSHLLPELNAGAVTRLKQQPGKDIIVFGSGSLVAELGSLGLIDEYRFIVAPVLLGSGHTLPTGVGKSTRLRLKDTKAYPSGNVALTYVRA
jgi:dihydrofolate reductase